MPSTSPAVVEWVRQRAHPLDTVEPDAPLTDLLPLVGSVGDATVVALGVSSRECHELAAVQHRVLRLLVEEVGFRSLGLEEDWTKGVQLDEYVCTGAGDPRALLLDSRFSATEEMLAAVHWMRSWNEQHPDDPVRVFGSDVTGVRALAYDAVIDYLRRTAPERLGELTAHYELLRPRGSIAEHKRWFGAREDKQPLLEHARSALRLVEALPAGEGHDLAVQHARVVLSFYEFHEPARSADDTLMTIAGRKEGFADECLAANTVWWHEHTGHRIVHWGGIAHTSNRAPRTRSHPDDPDSTYRSLGSRLRGHFGDAYLSVGILFDHGSVPYTVAPPPPDFAESVLAESGLPLFALDLRGDGAEPVRAWLDAPAKTRVMGPTYVPEDDRAYHIADGSFRDWFDVVVHCRQATPTRVLR